MGWDLPSTCPWCGGSRRRVPAGEEGSSRAVPSGPSKVSYLSQESSAPPALVSIRHCPALEVICCFINYLHTMGPLSAPEQHTLAFRSNALTSAHPNQTKCLCAAFPLPGPAPTPTLPRANHGCRPPPPDRQPWGAHHSAWWDHATGIAGLDSHLGCLGVPSPGCMAESSCVPIPHGWHQSWGLAAPQCGTEQSVGTCGAGCAGYSPHGCHRTLEALLPGGWCQQQQLRGHWSCPACAPSC